ncbi:MAG TPA: class I SAM-dependent methyltransferase [Bryobacteraceae bacterium]|nr:class I SAM-dependent methyltransferase [Bryobacteraceae bacterium]
MLKALARSLEDAWFDATRSVSTSRAVEIGGLRLAGPRRDGFMYLPSRARNARALLRALPLGDPARYAFVDLGSGAGRVLFIAAEFPFQWVVGVELSAELHQLAEENIRRFHWRRKRCPNIVSINASAADYQFPNENLVIFLFNPFGPSILRDVLKNLNDSLQRNRRSVFLAVLYPEYKEVIDQSAAQLKLIESTPRHAIYTT